MTLEKFLKTTGMTIAKFSAITKINVNTLTTYVRGSSEPTVSNAIKIVDASHGMIELKDLKKRKK